MFDSKDSKKNRCWECGAVGHRKPDCPVAIKNKNPRKRETPEATGASSTTTPVMATATVTPAPAVPAGEGQATAGATSSTASREEVRAKEENQVKALLQEANAMLSQLTKLAPMKVVTDEQLKEMNAALGSLGASHAYRAPLSVVEKRDALPVKVELASGQYITLKQNRAETLLATKDVEGALESTPILPLGALVQQLGCEMTWTRKGGLKVLHPQFGELRTFVRGNHPMIGETQALDLIAQLEDAKLKELENHIAGTYVKLMDVERAREWDVCMAKYIQTGQRNHALEALVSGHSPMGPMNSEMAAAVAIDVRMDNKSAWNYVKALPLRRALRKTMMDRRWAVRLFAQEDDKEIKALDSGEMIFVDINVHRSKLFSMKGESAAYKALMWAAVNGRIEGVFGAVPSNFGDELRSKMMWIWMVAKVVNRSCGLATPYIAMGGKASEAFWMGDQWKAFQHEHQLPLTETVDPNDGNAFLVATNLRLPTERPKDDLRLRHSRMWTPTFYQNLVEAIHEWRRFPNDLMTARMMKKMDGPLHGMTEAERARWIRHIQNNHVPFEKRCKTCIETSATGRAHRRVIAPSCYVLSVDLCGPFRVKGEYAGARGFKYALIGAYVMPKISGYKDAPTHEPNPEEEVVEEEEWMEELPQREEPLDPKDEEELKKSQERYDELMKGIGDTMEYQVLHYAIPLRTRLMKDVDVAVKTLYLQLRAEGLPVTRIHSDRARELRGADLRAWLVQRDVLPTCGEAQVPQTNGRAEAAVKQAKKRTKTLLMSSGLPRACWPWAMTYASFQQREFALGRANEVIPFGSPVHVKNKVFGTGHKYDLDNRWKEGIYVGPAPDIRHGHTVRFPEGRYVSSMHLKTRVVDIDREIKLDEVDMDLPSPSGRLRRKTASTRTTTGPGVGGSGDHLPAEDFDPHHDPPGEDDREDDGRGVFVKEDVGLEFPIDWEDGPVQMDGLFDDLPAEDFGPHHDPPGPSYEIDAALPLGVLTDDAALPLGVPTRRIASKSSLKALRPLSLPEKEAEAMAEANMVEKDYSHEAVLKLYERLERARQLFSRSNTRKPSSRTTSWITGMFSYGGVCGLRDGARRLPKVTQYLTKFAKDVAGIKEFGAVGIVKNSSLGCHRDLHNQPGSYNAVYPLSQFRGGGIWVQGTPEEDEDVLRKQVTWGLEGRCGEGVRWLPSCLFRTSSMA